MDDNDDSAGRLEKLEAERRALVALSIAYDQLLHKVVSGRRYRLAARIGNLIELMPARLRAGLERLTRISGARAILRPRPGTDRAEIEQKRLQQRLHAVLFSTTSEKVAGPLPFDASGQPLVSVVSVLYNSQNTVISFLKAFYAQSYCGSIEIVLVDDASNDGAARLATDFAEESGARQRTVRVIRNPRNLGNCLSRNAGVAAATGEIICILDADCVVNPGFIEAHVAMHACGYGAVIGPMGIESLGRPVARLMDELLGDRSQLRSQMRLQDPSNLQSAVNCVTRNFSVSRRVVRGLGRELFDPRFTYRNAADTRYGWEDVEMGAALRRWGTRIGFTWAAVSIHVSHGSSVNERTRAVGSARNFAMLLETHPHLMREHRDWSITTGDRIASWATSVGADPGPELAAALERMQQTGAQVAAPICVYSAAAGAYWPQSEAVPLSGVAHRLFTDGRPVEGWSSLPFDETRDDPVRTAKKPKVLPHIYFEHADWSIWIDANITLIADPSALIDEVEKSGHLVGAFKHPERACAYDEALHCISAVKDDPAIILAQIERYRRGGYPEKFGLAECNVLVRRHSDPGVAAAMRQWWDEIEAGSRRDQISFNYALWRSGLSYHELGAGQTNVRTDRRFRYRLHSVAPGTEIVF